MFFDDLFGDLFEDMTIPVILALDAEETEERDKNENTGDNNELEYLGKL